MKFVFIEKEYTEDDIVRSLPPWIGSRMMEVYLNWPVWELAVTRWLIRLYRLDPITAPGLLGNMETRTKLDKLKLYYTEAKDEKGVQFLGSISALHKRYVECRNIMTHCAFAGYLKDRPEIALFQTHKVVPGRDGVFSYQVHTEMMETTAKWAREAATFISNWLDEPPPTPPPEPSEETLPGPRPKRSRKAHSRPTGPPQSSRA